MRLTSEIFKSKMDVPKKFGSLEDDFPGKFRDFLVPCSFFEGCSFCETPVSSSIGPFSHFQLTQVASNGIWLCAAFHMIISLLTTGVPVFGIPNNNPQERSKKGFLEPMSWLVGYHQSPLYDLLALKMYETLGFLRNWGTETKTLAETKKHQLSQAYQALMVVSIHLKHIRQLG